jgi:hypothetical protein
LTTCRKAGAQLEALCDRASQCLKEALPVELIKSYGNLWVHKPRFDAVLESDQLEVAAQHLSFLVACRSFKPVVEFGRAHERAYKHATTYINDVCEDLLRLARRTSRHENHQIWVRFAARLVHAGQGLAAAEAFELRVNSAAA